ncbi:hypothetical protein NP233_g4423 [Leucocoprinus birnbaumii]|uniref:Haloacid dehalogenase-like hydrolase domain-containing protein 2 n=1 Tax=Leucocoprinus birnbaumii TaxID=56174 RepID=A0AAD5VXF3_9AGAR|nr:hypothetical protein NP233_g4423 [Leucocoprinus birnbaumii]
MSQTPTRPLIRALLIDVSGNLHVGSKPTPDAVDAFRRLKASGIPFRLCSNTSKESTQSLVSRLNKLGFGIVHSQDLEESSISGSVVGSASNSRDYGGNIQRAKPRQEVWTSIGAVSRYIRNQGLKQPYLLLSPSAKEEVTRDIPTGLDALGYDSVVVGLAPDMFNYSHLNTAFRVLKGEVSQSEKQNSMTTDTASKRQPPRLIATHKAKYIQTENPPGLSLGPGPFVTALECAAAVEAHVIGELEQIEHRGRVAVIGDDVEADLSDGAVQMGLWRILVKTGKYRSGDESRPGMTPPDEVFDSFAAFVDSLLATQSRSALLKLYDPSSYASLPSRILPHIQDHRDISHLQQEQQIIESMLLQIITPFETRGKWLHMVIVGGSNPFQCTNTALPSTTVKRKFDASL